MFEHELELMQWKKFCCGCMRSRFGGEFFKVRFG